MATQPEDAAFVIPDVGKDFSGGFTKREYAAIALGVPNSGLGWLDEMIREKQRQDMAKTAAQGLLSNPAHMNKGVKDVVTLAEALIAALNKESPKE